MGSSHNRSRGKWQDYSGENAGIAENNFFEVFKEHFKNKSYRVRAKPNEFQDIYVQVTIEPHVQSEIYNPADGIKKHGIRPDYAIDNLATKKTLYVEVKRQDGWVEGKPRSAGRGNAHERSCKYFTPGLLRVLRERGGIKQPEALPFWTVFQGDITRDPCRVREITLWYEEFQDHFFFWRNDNNSEILIQHFEQKLKKFLD